MALSAPLPRRRITASEFLRMVEVGILREDERVELLEGEIVEMTPIGSRHMATVNKLVDLLRHFADEFFISVQNAIHLSDVSIPQPDFALLRRREDFYYHALPTVADVLLLIEVSDSTVGQDRRVKIPLYARAGVAEVWLLDVVRREMQIYRQPTPEGYESVLTPPMDTFLAPDAIPSMSFRVDDLFV